MASEISRDSRCIVGLISEGLIDVIVLGFFQCHAIVNPVVFYFYKRSKEIVRNIIVVDFEKEREQRRHLPN